MMNLVTGLVGIAAMFLGLGANALAQVAAPKTSGVYLTGADYQEARLAYEGDCRSETHKLELHDVLHKSYIHVTHDGQKKRFAKTALFGFRACDGRDYRFVADLEYQILEAKALYIYRREVLVSHGRGRHGVKTYYFSVGPDGEVRPLTIEDLKQAFPGNDNFRRSVDATFGAGQNLAEYDSARKTFTVNRLLAESRQGPS